MKEKQVIKLFRDMLEKYKLARPVDPDVRKHIRRIKEREFRKTMKKAGSLSVLMIVVSNFFFMIRRWGFNISMAQSAVLTGFISIVVAGSVTAGTYKLISSSLAPPTVKEKTMQNEAPEQEGVDMPKPDTGSGVPGKQVPGGSTDDKSGKKMVSPEKSEQKAGGFDDEPIDHVPGM